MTELHIIEPTLANHAGHCHGYVQSLLRANQMIGFDLHLWLAWQGRQLFSKEAVTLHPYFSKRFRKVQKWLCYRQLLKQGKALFIPTAGRLDLIVLDMLSNKANPTGPVFLHFHQFTKTPKKLALLKKLSNKHPEWVMMAPTAGLAQIFIDSGFKHVECVPCPGYDSPIQSDKNITPLNHVLYAGAARSDKGFPVVVDWLAWLTTNASDIPVHLQISPPYSGRYDKRCQHALAKLQQLNYNALTIYQETLSPKAYQTLYQGALCLLPYDAHAYRDKVSGIALDAFLSGSPVVTLAGTWMAQQVQRFHAGIVVDNTQPDTLQNAIKTIFAHQAKYQQAAIEAGIILRQEHDPKHTLHLIQRHLAKHKDTSYVASSA